MEQSTLDFENSRWSSIFLGRIVGVMFMPVNSKCAHQVRPPLGPTGDTRGQIHEPSRPIAMPTVGRVGSRTLQVLRLFFPNVIDRQALACEGGSTLTHVV